MQLEVEKPEWIDEDKLKIFILGKYFGKAFFQKTIFSIKYVLVAGYLQANAYMMFQFSDNSTMQHEENISERDLKELFKVNITQINRDKKINQLL